MASLSTWIRASRPKTLIAGLSPVLICTVIVNPKAFPVWMLVCVLALTALGIQIISNLANDYFDCLKGADTPERKGPTRVMAAGLVSQREMQWAIRISVGITALSGSILVFQGGWLFALLLALAILLAILYTGGPYPLAYLGLGDLFVFVFFGPVAIGSAYLLLTGRWDLTPFIVGLAPGALSTALIAINNLRDVEEDRAADKNTLIVRLGKGFGKGEIIVCLLIPLIVPLFFLHSHPFVYGITLGMFLPSLRLGIKVFRAKEDSSLLINAAQLLLLLTVLFYLFWNL